MKESESVKLQDLIDDGTYGPEPAENYLERLNMLDNVVREGIEVSRGYAGIRSPQGRHFYASVLFVALITRGISLLNLAPHSPWAEKKIEHWDYASMTGVVRTMIELRAAFFYLCSEPCSQDEWYCRWNLFNLHDCVSRIRLFSATGDSEQVAGFEAQAGELRERLRSNPFFQSLDRKRHKKLLHGQTAYLSPLEVLMERAGMEVETFRFLYILFSTHVHALPMSFYRIGGDNAERGRGLPSSAEEGYSSLCLSLAASLIVKSRDEFHTLFEGLLPDPAYTAGVAGAARDEAAEDKMLAIGETASHNANQGIRIERTRESETEVRVRYVHRQTGEAVFEGHASDTDGLQFSYIDPYFWDIYLNGASTSCTAIERAVEGDFLLSVDVERRRVLFKTHVAEKPS